MICIGTKISHGRHFHLEQPQGSDTLKQPELYDLMTGTLTSSFDQCTVGKLHVPGRSIVQRTSRILHHRLHGQWCQRKHEHQMIEGSYKHHNLRQNISAFAARYTSTFARHITRVLLGSVSVGEDPLAVEELLAGFETSEGQNRSLDSRGIALESLQLKLRKLDFKQARPLAFQDQEEVTWEELMKEVPTETPRVEVHRIRGLLSERIGSIPEMDVQLVLSCRGTDRYGC